MLIKNMLEDLGDGSIREDNPIPIPNVCPGTSQIVLAMHRHVH